MTRWIQTHDVLLCIILCHPYIVCFPPGRLTHDGEEEMNREITKKESTQKDKMEYKQEMVLRNRGGNHFGFILIIHGGLNG